MTGGDSMNYAHTSEQPPSILPLDQDQRTYLETLVRKREDSLVFNILVETCVDGLIPYIESDDDFREEDFQSGSIFDTISELVNTFDVDMAVALINGCDYYEEHFGEFATSRSGKIAGASQDEATECRSESNENGLRTELQYSAEIALRNEVWDRCRNRDIIEEDD